MTEAVKNLVDAVEALLNRPAYTPFYERKNLEQAVRERLAETKADLGLSIMVGKW